MGDIWSTDDTVAPGGADPLAWVLPVGTPDQSFLIEWPSINY